MARLDESSDEFQHRKGQEDGSSGALFGTNGDCTTRKYQEGFDAGKFDHDQQKFGRVFAEVAKDERDYVRRLSNCSKSNEPSSGTTCDYREDKDDRSRHTDYVNPANDFIDKVSKFFKFALVGSGMAVALWYFGNQASQNSGTQSGKPRQTVLERIVDGAEPLSELNKSYLKQNNSQYCVEVERRLIALSNIIRKKEYSFHIMDFSKQGSDLWVIANYMKKTDNKKGGSVIFRSKYSDGEWETQWTSNIKQFPIPNLNYNCRVEFGVVQPKIIFENQRRGVAVVYDDVIRTEDGGVSWHSSAPPK